MKKYIILALLSITVIACGPAIVTTRPVEPVVVIPPSPGPGYVWVGGSWTWNRGTRAHHYVNGYWARPASPEPYGLTVAGMKHAEVGDIPVAVGVKNG